MQILFSTINFVNETKRRKKFELICDDENILIMKKKMKQNAEQ